MESTAKNKKYFYNICLRILLFIVVVAFCIFLFFKLSGTTSTTQKIAEPISNNSLTCKKSNLDYPFFEYLGADQSTTEVSIIFANEELKSISLSYTQDYSDNSGPVDSNNVNRVAMDLSFYDHGLETDEFNANYYVMENQFKMTLYTRADELENENSRAFFLINTSELSFDTLKNNYEAQGFTCSTH